MSRPVATSPAPDETGLPDSFIAETARLLLPEQGTIRHVVITGDGTAEVVRATPDTYDPVTRELQLAAPIRSIQTTRVMDIKGGTRLTISDWTDRSH